MPNCFVLLNGNGTKSLVQWREMAFTVHRCSLADIEDLCMDNSGGSVSSIISTALHLYFKPRLFHMVVQMEPAIQRFRLYSWDMAFLTLTIKNYR